MKKDFLSDFVEYAVPQFMKAVYASNSTTAPPPERVRVAREFALEMGRVYVQEIGESKHGIYLIAKRMVVTVQGVQTAFTPFLMQRHTPPEHDFERHANQMRASGRSPYRYVDAWDAAASVCETEGGFLYKKPRPWVSIEEVRH